MAAMNFSTRNETCRRLMSNGLTCAVPRFQRDDSWDQDEWEDLWQDTLAAMDGDGSGHSLGYLVFRSEDERHFEVIDGQQRLTTLSLLVLAGLRRLQALPGARAPGDKVARRIRSLRQSCVGAEDPVTLVSEPKLRLHRNNDACYRDFLVPLRRPLPKYGLKASELACARRSKWFDGRLRTRVRDEEDPGRAHYSVKRRACRKSAFAGTRRLPADAREWTPETIAARQRGWRRAPPPSGGFRSSAELAPTRR